MSKPSTLNVTVGGLQGHLKRRLFHVFNFVVFPYVYYGLGRGLEASLGVVREKVLFALSIAVVLLEALRLSTGFVWTGVRSYERHNIGALASGTFATLLVFRFAPHRNGGLTPWDDGFMGIPIVLTVGLIDPLLGEMKNFKVRGSIRFLVGFAATFLLWASCVYVGANDSSFAWTMVPIMTFTCVLVEYPDIPSVDDNLLLQLVPLAIVLASAAHWNGPL